MLKSEMKMIVDRLLKHIDGKFKPEEYTISAVVGGNGHVNCYTMLSELYTTNENGDIEINDIIVGSYISSLNSPSVFIPVSSVDAIYF